jgi:hypothetical protein
MLGRAPVQIDAPAARSRQVDDRRIHPTCLAVIYTGHLHVHIRHLDVHDRGGPIDRMSVDDQRCVGPWQAHDPGQLVSWIGRMAGPKRNARNAYHGRDDGWGRHDVRGTPAPRRGQPIGSPVKNGRSGPTSTAGRRAGRGGTLRRRWISDSSARLAAAGKEQQQQRISSPTDHRLLLRAAWVWGSVSSPLRVVVSYQLVAMYLASRNSINPSWAPSRPSPLCLTPPKGAAGSEIKPRLRPTMPASMASATRSPLARSRV